MSGFEVHRIATRGDTPFALGCGRLFEGTAEQMWNSLPKFKVEPDGDRFRAAMGKQRRHR